MLPPPLTPAQSTPATVAQPPRKDVAALVVLILPVVGEPGVKSTVPPAPRVMAPSWKPVGLLLPLVETTTAEPPEFTVMPLKACTVPLLLEASFRASFPPPSFSA